MILLDKATKTLRVQRLWISLVAVWLICIVCYVYVDKAIIEWAEYTRWHPILLWFEKITPYGEAQNYLLLSGGSMAVGLAGFLLIHHPAIKRVSRKLVIFSFCFFCSVALSGLMVNALKIIFGRYRPYYYLHFGKYGLHGFIWHTSFSSFPSGHSQVIWAAMTALSLRFPKLGYVAYPVAVLIAISRVMTRYHYPSDVLMGSYIGFVTAVLVYYGFLRLGYWIRHPKAPHPNRARSLEAND